jgi:DNA invertase Pin-like site-specific DNA recombinase
MTAAIYARKSTEQNGISDEEKFVTRQIDHAREYATRKGWTVSDAHLYVDDGISGAESDKRPGYMRLLRDLKPKPKYQVLVMSEESRLGRQGIDTLVALKQIIKAGVRVFFYLEDREAALGSFSDNTMAFLRAEVAAEARREAARRTYDAMRR